MVIDYDALMVLSFFALYAAVFLSLLVIVDRFMQWVMDNGLFWYVAVPVATAIWMSNIGG